MALENASEIQQLVPTNPEGGDPLSEGDNHIRMVKLCLQNSLPGMTGPWKTSSRINAADPVDPQDLVTLAFLRANAEPAVGWPVIWLLPLLPGDDYLDLAGQLLLRADYPELFAFYGTTYGPGDGATTFKLPDFRGYFMRVQDQGRGVDPDAAERLPRGDGIAGDNVGTLQPDAIVDHSHFSSSDAEGTSQKTGGTANVPKVGLTTGLINSDVETSSENRPININIRMIIRAK